MTDTVETNVEVAVAPVEVAPVVKPEKVQLYKIFVNPDGTEIERKPLGKGRPPKNSKKDEAGNLVVTVVPTPDGTPEKITPMIITLDEAGNEISRTEKGRGRPAKGLIQHTEGQYKGHWVKTQVAAAVAETAPEITPVATEAPAVIVAPVEAAVEAETTTNPQ